WTERTALIGIFSGTLFGISAVSFRAASLSLGGPDSGEGPGFLMQAGFTLAFVILAQTVGMALWMTWREPGQLGAVLRSWRWASLAGFAGALSSIGWFTAMTLQNVAYVRALGQIELVFTFAAGIFIFKERSTRVEVIGILLVVAGILILIGG
ncbi:MAG: EamA family transporter, partial [Alphaproteobacteria bacterium]|nr:EamA family transporter [Alphaproteobacteria bacterium]